MPKHLPLLVAIAGLVLTALYLWDLIESLEVLVSAGVMGARESGGSLDPTMMGKLVGEAIITVVSRSIWIPIPTALLYIAWVPLRYRPRWFRMVMVAVSIFFLQQIPVGTICGLVLIIAMRRHRAIAVSPLPVVLALLVCTNAFAGAADLSVSAYPSIQAALDANPGRMIFVPAGDYPTTEKIRIHGDHAGLFGPGRIIASNPEQPILEVEHASFAQVRDLTLTRAEGKMDGRKEGLIASDCHDLVIDDVRVLENHSPAGAITVRESKNTRISHCLVRNYTCISIDDRTASKDLYGYAFRCIDGTGISVSYSTGSLIEGNRVEERNLRPTQAIKEKFGLGKFTKKVAEKPPLMNQKTWDAEYVDNWHQGSGIVVNAPSVADQTRLIGNHVQNAAQGIDLHCDHIIVSQNIVDNAFIGMKAMHGSRNVLITGNQFLRNDLWAIGLMPGAASTPENSDGGSIIANNIISEFGKGDAHWIWGDGHSPFKFDHGQKVENPPLMDVVIQGNVVDCIGAPLYKYVVIIEDGSNGPRGMHFSNNVFHAGTAGVANVELQP